ncbi:T9SS type A sorting domain-containing protein [Winogradskyella poriferorum]|uniref:T9SS type A sorting domain-containing protein n=1 Tax=Winogradskyella poriferorum TaxID=307627 RepID=A0ABU7WAA1_9FLAO
MRIKLLNILLLILITFNSDAQIPPPCGITPIVICDQDLDGVVLVDLSEIFPFNFCSITSSEASNYYPLTYYLSEEDALNSANALNAESFFASEYQDIYRRADPINSEEHNVLIAGEPLIIGTAPTANWPTPLFNCEFDDSGFSVFDLYSKSQEIIYEPSDLGNYLTFYETYDDAINLINPLPLEYTNVTPNNQTIFACVSLNPFPVEYNCREIVELDLIVNGSQCEDISVDIVRISAPPRPGFAYSNRLYISNEHTTTVENGNVEFLYGDLLLFQDMSFSSPNLSATPLTNGFSVNFTSLEAGEEVYVDFNFLLPSDVPLGTILSSNATYTTNSTDFNPINNNSSLTLAVVGSYDPNDKMESHGPSLIYDDFINSDEWLYYTIRFQNIGTAEAIFVRIEDELDVQLDERTFQMLRSSHDYSVTRVGNNLEWYFDNINLPAEQDDPAGSVGFVYFRLKPKPGYAIGDIIPNNAAIYFDFNAPIITNTFNTTFVETLSVNELDATQVSVFPNPAEEKVIITVNQNVVKSTDLSLFDIQGKMINVPQKELGNTIELNVSSLNSGLYFVKFRNGNNSFIEKLIVK